MQIQMTDNSSGSMVAEIHLSPRHVPRLSHIYVKGLRVTLDPVEYQVRLVGEFFFRNCGVFFKIQRCFFKMSMKIMFFFGSLHNDTFFAFATMW